METGSWSEFPCHDSIDHISQPNGCRYFCPTPRFGEVVLGGRLVEIRVPGHPAGGGLGAALSVERPVIGHIPVFQIILLESKENAASVASESRPTWRNRFPFEQFYFEVRGAQPERGVRLGRKDGVIEFGIRRVCAKLQYPFALLRAGAAGEGVGLENYPAAERQPSLVSLRRAVVEKYFEASGFLGEDYVALDISLVVHYREAVFNPVARGRDLPVFPARRETQRALDFRRAVRSAQRGRLFVEVDFPLRKKRNARNGNYCDGGFKKAVHSSKSNCGSARLSNKRLAAVLFLAAFGGFSRPQFNRSLFSFPHNRPIGKLPPIKLLPQRFFAYRALRGYLFAGKSADNSLAFRRVRRHFILRVQTEFWRTSLCVF